MKKNTKIKISVDIAMIVFLTGVCTIDSNSVIPLILTICGGTWLCLVAYANGWIK